MRSLFTLAFIFVFILIAVRHSYAAMLMYWWFGIFRPHEWIWWDVSSLRLPLLAAIIFICPLVFRKRFPAVSDPISKMILLLLALALISVGTAGCLYPNPVSTMTIVTFTIVTLFSAMLLKHPWHFIVYLSLVGTSLFFHSAKTGLLSAIDGTSLYGAIIGSGGFTGSNAMSLGTAMGMFFLIFAMQCLSKEKINALLPFVSRFAWLASFVRLGLLVCIIGGVAFIASTGSRGSAIALGIGFSFWLILHPNKFRVVFLAILLLVSAVSIFGIPEQLKERLETAFVEQSELDNSAASRPHFWNVAVLMANAHPMGIGVGCYQSYYDSYDTSKGQHGSYRSVHSSHFAMLAETGYLGGIVWVIILIKSMFILLTIRRKNIANVGKCHQAWFLTSIANALLCTLIVFIFGGSFYEMPYNDFTWIVFSCVIALSVLDSKRSEIQQKTSTLI